MGGKAGRELVVESGSAHLAVRDRGGGGRPVLLLHGYSGTPYDFVSLRPRLPAHLRVVELELRSHGRSRADTWSWSDAISDVEAVIARLELHDAAVVGFSFGGMIAAKYAEAHPETTAVVNVDGYGTGALARHVPTGVHTLRRLDELRAFRRSRIGRTLTQEELDAKVAEAEAAAERAGLPRADAREAALRRVRRSPDGGWERLPEASLATAMLEAVDALDLPSLYLRIDCPLLTVLALQPDAAPKRTDLWWLPELHASYIAGLRDELRRLGAARPNLELVEVDAPHGRLLSHALVAGSIVDFLARHGPRAEP